MAGLAALVAVVAGAVWLAQAFPAGRDEATMRAPTPAPAIPTAGPGTLAPRLDRSTFVSRVRDGTLEDRLVFADARLDRVYCENEGIPTCPAPKLNIAGVSLDIVPGATVRGRSLVVPPRALLVFRVWGGRLEYFGSLMTHHEGSPALAALTAEIESSEPRVRQPTLWDAGGWLVLNPVCHADIAAASCPTGPFLADEAPMPDGTLRSEAGSPVALSEALWGIDPARDTVTGGPFMVRATDVARQDAGAPPWEVVARYDPSRSVRVVIP